MEDINPRAFVRGDTLKRTLVDRAPHDLPNPFDKGQSLRTMDEFIKTVAEAEPGALGPEIISKLTEMQNTVLLQEENFSVQGSLGVPLKFFVPVVDPSPPSSPLSVKAAFQDAVVLITGATGYIGSLVVEQLLRTCPGLKKIYFLARGKKGSEARARVDKLLKSGLFHLVRDKPELLSKVEVVEGDISLPRVGIPDEDYNRVASTTTVIIHSAARIALEDHIQTTLKFNYIGTRHVLDFAEACPNLQAFTHVSSCYVNFDQPHGACVQETLYPLMLHDNPVHHEDLANELLNLDPDSSKYKVETLAANWHLPNTYTLGKRLTEQMVAERHVYWQKNAKPGKTAPSCAIVRPSLVAAVACAPYPGYVGNWAGTTGFVVAYAMGFSSRHGSAWKSKYMLDTVPGDVASSCVLGATAAVLKGHANKDAPFIVHAASTTTHPLAHAEVLHLAYKWYSKFPPKFKLNWGRYDPGVVKYEPNPWLVWLHRIYMRCLLWLIFLFLKLTKKDRFARQLELGYQQWEDANDSKYNKTVSFSARNAIALQNRLVPAEQDTFPMVWTSRRMLWPQFFYTYMAFVHRGLFKFKETPPSSKDIPHQFKFIE